MISRRDFIKKLSQVSLLPMAASLLPACDLLSGNDKTKYKISLAEWSLHSALFNKEISNLDFPVLARREYEVEGVEYVSQFFQDKAKNASYLSELKKISNNEGITNVLIMVDQEGHLSSNDQTERIKAVENHYKWVEVAKTLECHSIRINLHGNGNEEEWLEASVDGLGRLTEYGEKNDINIIVENHGQWSSKGYLLAEVMNQVNNPFCGTLPDFGNFCVKRRDGDLWESPCIETYDKYKGVTEILPYAKGISAKTFAFDDNGEETTIDFSKMFKLIKQSDYEGFIGIEYEGGTVSEDTGIKLTKKLIEKNI